MRFILRKTSDDYFIDEINIKSLFDLVKFVEKTDCKRVVIEMSLDGSNVIIEDYDDFRE